MEMLRHVPAGAVWPERTGAEAGSMVFAGGSFGFSEPLYQGFGHG